MALDNMLGDGKPQARSSPAARPVRLVEALKDPCKIISRNAHACVFNRKHHLVPGCSAETVILPPGSVNLMRCDQVRHHQLHPLSVGKHQGQLGGKEDGEFQACPFRLRSQPLGQWHNHTR